MKKYALLTLVFSLVMPIWAQTGFTSLYPDDSITEVQPMTGIVFWHNSGDNNTDAISLEFSYMLFNEVVSDSGVYNWTAVETKLDAIASRNHQAIFRFRYVYPGYETSVPDYILAREDYNETIGNSEGKSTHFPDWTNEELKRFTMEFYTKFAERYDNDPRLAFIQVGFGLWGEYHIYSGPFILGETFPSKEFQEEFFRHLDTTFINIPWSISVDAADGTYSPIEAKPELKQIKFGLFDDSFMHRNHAGYNTTCWNFFDRERYRTSPAGGEFSYYSSYDQEHVLDYPYGPYGKSYERFAREFHITYIMGNDQPNYQTMERIRQASMASGYRFKIASLETTADSSVFRMTNCGVAPFYYDAYVAVNGVRSPQSLKLMAEGDTIICPVSAGAEGAVITIECDKLVPGQKIGYFGTQEVKLTSVKKESKKLYRAIYPNPARRGETIYVKGNRAGTKAWYSVYDGMGKLELSGSSDLEVIGIGTELLEIGIYYLTVESDRRAFSDRFIVL